MDDEGSALGSVQALAHLVEGWTGRLQRLEPIAEALRAAAAHLEDASANLRSLSSDVEADPARLEELEERLAELVRLERKHRTDSAGLCARQAQIGAEIEALEHSEVDREELEAALTVARAALDGSARRLSAERRAASVRLSHEVQVALAELGLERAHFSVEFGVCTGADPKQESPLTDHQRYGLDGADEIEFMLSANPGEPPAPLRQVASGGEAARIMLALRTALAVHKSTPTLVFDEVDAGVGGRLGPKLAAHLRSLARQHQVLCVTHLPAIAAAAHNHLRVHKEVQDDRTRTAVSELEGEARVQEIADMIAGGRDQPTARAEACRLLESQLFPAAEPTAHPAAPAARHKARTGRSVPRSEKPNLGRDASAG